MLVIPKTPSEAGQYPAIQQSTSAGIPEGFYWWPYNLERATFFRYEGFVILTIKRNTVASYVPNEEAYEAWKASQAPAEPTDTEVLNTLLGGLTMDIDRLLTAEQQRRALQMFAGTLTEEQALEIASVYPAWAAGTAYAVGDIISYGTNPVGDPQLYKVVQAHTSQAEWTPDSNPSLYDAFGLDESGYTIWAQPSGAHDAYNTGDIVNYNGTLYKSLIDGNVWAPDVYPAGWELYEAPAEPEPGPTPEPEPKPEPTTYPEFVQPAGAHDAYSIGDIVSYNGKLYRSLIDGNTWSPDAYPQGWEEYTP